MQHTIGPINFDAARRLLDELVESARLPGASLLLIDDGGEAHFHCVGWRDVESAAPLERDTLFRIYSMTKPIIAAAVMALVEDGLLDLDCAVGGFLPELRRLASDGDRCEITARHLLTHTAGFSYWFQGQEPVAKRYARDLGAGADEQWRFSADYGGLEGLVASLSRLPLVDRPGARWHYGMSLDVAGLLIERASGRRLDRFLGERLFGPLGMRDTHFAVPPDDAGRLASLYAPERGGGLRCLETGAESPLLGAVPGLSGGGGLVSTIDDYSRFAEMLRARGMDANRQILSAASVNEMMRNQLAPEQLAELPDLAAFGLGGSGDGLGFGLGGAVVLEPSRQRQPANCGAYGWGGGASTTFWVDPANGFSVIFMTQLTPPGKEMLRDRLHQALYR